MASQSSEKMRPHGDLRLAATLGFSIGAIQIEAAGQISRTAPPWPTDVMTMHKLCRHILPRCLAS